ncbi:MAG: hypothetical protein V9F03_15945 [Microthrixaceae bacterium]
MAAGIWVVGGPPHQLGWLGADGLWAPAWAADLTESRGWESSKWLTGWLP